IKEADPFFSDIHYPKLQSKLFANNNIILNAARDIDLTSTVLSSQDKAIVLSGRDIKLGATAYSTIENPHEDDQDIQYVTTAITGNKGITLASNDAITTQGSTIKSEGDITISSGGNIQLGSVRTHFRKGSGSDLEDIYKHIGTDISSGKNLTLLSEGSILFQASKLTANNAIDIAAKGGFLYAQAMEESSYYKEKKKKCNWWTLCITKKKYTKTFYNTNNKVTEFIANGDISLFAKDDITLEATKINTAKNAKITSKTGKVNFKAVKNTAFKQVITHSKDIYITQRNQGYNKENWALPELYIGGKLTIDAPAGISADIKTKKKQTLEQVLTVLSNTPEYAWLNDLQQHENVNWNLVKETYASWDEKSQQLNPVVGAIIAIAVGVATYGTSTAATIGGMASKAATAAGASASIASTASVAAQAGFASLASQAAVSLAENRGDLLKTVKSLGSSDTVKSIVTSMAVAGALQGLDQFMGWDKAIQGGTLPSTGKLLATDNATWNQVAQRVAAHSVVSSTLGTAIQGGNFIDNFKTALLSNIGSQFHAEGANLIGNNGAVLGHAGKILSHSVVAGISAEIAGGSVTGAVAGALAAEIAAISLQSKLFEPQFESESNKQLYEFNKFLKSNSEFNPQIVRFIGGLAGALATNKPEGAYSGANSAETVYRFNDETHYISPSDIEAGEDLYLAMRGDKEAQKRVDARKEALTFSLTVGALGYSVLYVGAYVIAVAPQLLATAKTAISTCKTTPFICLNNSSVHLYNVVGAEATVAAPAATTGSFYIASKNAHEIKNVLHQAEELVTTFNEVAKVDAKGAKEALRYTAQELRNATIAGKPVLTNYRVLDLSKLNNTALDVDKIRAQTFRYLKADYKKDSSAVSYAIAAVTKGENTEYFLAVSGKAWSGRSPQLININGIIYKVISQDKKTTPSVLTTDNNFNHAEQKIFDYLHRNNNGEKIKIALSIQNTSLNIPGMCIGCNKMSLNFAKLNQNYDITIYHGTIGTNP
ncbi:DUF637 domain-containing protein, partial [Proteus hauseri]|uniref:DUF637 domain-containing protein n=1 Tax=Proteus hauseri TaxID=183417 RepID=UPI0032DAEC90